MKKSMLIFLSGLALGALILYFFLNKTVPLPGQARNHETTSFRAVTSSLDPGGNLYFYANTARISRACTQFAENLRKIFEKSELNKQEHGQKILPIFEFLLHLAETSGFSDIDGLGVSSVALNKTLNHTRIVIHRRNKKKGLLWQMHHPRVHELTCLPLLPADTVFAKFSDFRPHVAWEWLKKKTGKSGIKEIENSLTAFESLLKIRGIDLPSLLKSLDGTAGILLTLNDRKLVRLPGKAQNLQIPEPAAALVLTSTDRSLFDLLKARLPMLVSKEEDGISILSMPAPGLFFNLAPEIAAYKNFLILATSHDLIKKMIAARKKKNGLASVKEFIDLSGSMPAQGNQFHFISSRLSSTLHSIRDQVIKKSPQPDADKALFSKLQELFSVKICQYGVMEHTKSGLIYTCNHQMNPENLLLLPVTLLAGIVSAVAVPNLLTAIEKNRQKRAMADLRTIGTGIEAYMADHGFPPKAANISELAELLEPFFLKKMPGLDPWGKPYLYSFSKAAGFYALACSGKDAVFSGWEQRGTYKVAHIRDFARDIIFSNGQFVFFPHKGK